GPGQDTVVVERWWQVPLSKEGRPPRLHPRRHRIYRLLEDTKHQPRGELELILTRSVEDLGNRGDVVSVKKHVGRNKLLPQGLAVYASPENRRMFEEEKKLRQEGKLEVLQTQSGEKTIRFLKSCRLEVGMKNNVKWELNNEIVARHFLKNVSFSRRRRPEPPPTPPGSPLPVPGAPGEAGNGPWGPGSRGGVCGGRGSAGARAGAAQPRV
ncbi:PREDICTED: 39S ribosomal protein L9, mitochondrial, partial [Calidris pugnax]|uniref:39S ribosomal protein L9, mitochondrial n=1 Tax=Calidris pugnax TaxID=198806 RepID=UPI00071D37E0